MAVWFIYVRIEDDFLVKFQQIALNEIHIGLIIVATLLVGLNWGLEAVKWKYAIRKVEKITIFDAFKFTITGITIGLITPNRIGEIPARALLLNKNSFSDLTLKTIVASFSQLMITLLIGTIGFVFIHDQFNLEVSSTILNFVLLCSTFVLLLLYFKVNRLEAQFNSIKYFRNKELFKALSEFSFVELSNLLLLSFLRYLVFSIQFWLVLKAFGITLLNLEDILLIPVCFMFASFIPTIIISEIGVRSSVALFVFGLISDMDIQIILASTLLWLINVAVPASIGLLSLKEFKIVREK